MGCWFIHNFKSLEKIGVATNLVGRWIGGQLLFIYPSTIQFDEQSPARTKGEVLDGAEGKVDVEWGISGGVTFLDGVLAVGYGALFYDRRDFNNPDALAKSNFRDSFVYFNVQAIEAIKGAIKAWR